MKRNLIFFVLISFFSVLIIPDISSAQVIDLGGNLGVALPQGEFKNKVNQTGFHITGNASFCPNENLPFSVGLNVGYVIYGNETRKEPWSTTIPDAFLTVKRTNNLVNFHALFQIIPFKWKFRPYLEGLFGGAYIFTTTSVESDYQDKELTSSTNFDDWAWNYGAGGGFQIYLTKSNNEISESTIYLDLKARYLFGTEAAYLKEGSVKIINGKVYYDIAKSKTDLLYISLGVVVSIKSF